MTTTMDYINQLKKDKENLVSMLQGKGVEASNEETFTSLAPKVGTIVTDPILQDKSVEITENGEQTISADEGYDGLSNVTVTTNISSSGLEISNAGLFDYVANSDVKGGDFVAIETEVNMLSNYASEYSSTTHSYDSHTILQIDDTHLYLFAPMGSNYALQCKLVTVNEDGTCSFTIAHDNVITTPAGYKPKACFLGDKVVVASYYSTNTTLSISVYQHDPVTNKLTTFLTYSDTSSSLGNNVYVLEPLTNNRVLIVSQQNAVIATIGETEITTTSITLSTTARWVTGASISDNKIALMGIPGSSGNIYFGIATVSDDNTLTVEETVIMSGSHGLYGTFINPEIIKYDDTTFMFDLWAYSTGSTVAPYSFIGLIKLEENIPVLKQIEYIFGYAPALCIRNDKLYVKTNKLTTNTSVSRFIFYEFTIQNDRLYLTKPSAVPSSQLMDSNNTASITSTLYGLFVVSRASTSSSTYNAKLNVFDMSSKISKATSILTNTYGVVENDGTVGDDVKVYLPNRY